MKKIKKKLDKKTEELIKEVRAVGIKKKKFNPIKFADGMFDCFLESNISLRSAKEVLEYSKNTKNKDYLAYLKNRIKFFEFENKFNKLIMDNFIESKDRGKTEQEFIQGRLKFNLCFIRHYERYQKLKKKKSKEK